MNLPSLGSRIPASQAGDMDIGFNDLVTNVVGGLLTALILYLLGRLVVRHSNRASSQALGWPASGQYTAPAHTADGPMLRRGRAPLVLGCIAAALMLLAVDCLSPPFGVPGVFRELFPWMLPYGSGAVQNEAEITIRRAEQESQNRLREAEREVIQVMRTAANEAAEFKERGNLEAAERILALADSQARLVQEQAKKSAERTVAVASERAKQLQEEAVRMWRTEISWLGLLTNTARHTAEWFTRFLILGGLAVLMLRVWALPLPQLTAGASLAVSAPIFGLLTALGTPFVLDLLWPLYVIAVIKAGECAASAALGAVDGVVILQRKFAAVAVMTVCVLVVTAIAASISVLSPPVITVRSTVFNSEGNIVTYGASQYWTELRDLFVGLAGLEIGRTVTAMLFLSVLMGPERRAEKDATLSAVT